MDADRWMLEGAADQNRRAQLKKPHAFRIAAQYKIKSLGIQMGNPFAGNQDRLRIENQVLCRERAAVGLKTRDAAADRDLFRVLGEQQAEPSTIAARFQRPRS